MNEPSTKNQENTRPTGPKHKQHMRTERLKNQTVARKLVATSFAVMALASTATVLADDHVVPTLPSPLCDGLQVPAGNELKFHAYAVGVQIYQWNGSGWAFVAPAAVLYADRRHHAEVGIHYAGPTWESNSGSKVVGARVAACTPDPNSIPWLLLRAVSSQGPGVFDGVTFIQRLETVGGTAPSTPGSAVGQQAQVPYTAEYLFYSAEDTEEEDS